MDWWAKILLFQHWQVSNSQVDSTHQSFTFLNYSQLINFFEITFRTLIHHLKVIMTGLKWYCWSICIVLKNYGDISSKSKFNNHQQKYSSSDKIQFCYCLSFTIILGNKTNTTNNVSFIFFPISSFSFIIFFYNNLFTFIIHLCFIHPFWCFFLLICAIVNSSFY